jgi:twitching motility protein PilT
LSKLGQLLSYLERPGVTELVFRSGVPAVMHSANRLHPLTVTPLQVSQIRRFFEGTPVMTRLPKGDEVPPQTHAMELLGAIYQVTIAGNASSVEVRIAKDAQPRSSTWSEMPAVDVPMMRERWTSTGEGTAAMPPTMPSGVLTARPSPAASDSSSGMLAASPEWIIERNDDHGHGLATSAAVTRRDVAPILPPREPTVDLDSDTRRDVTVASLREPELDDAALQLGELGELEDSSGHAPPRRATVASPRPAAAPAPTASPRPVSGPAPVARSRPVSAPVAAATPPGPASPRVQPRAGAPFPARLRELLVTARQQGASDVHVMAGNPVRMRRAGALEPVGNPSTVAELEAMAAPLLQTSHAAQLEALGYADLAADVEGAGRLRINVSRQRTGLKLCFRLVVSEPLGVAELGLPPEVHKLTMHHQGLVIISGPNGHGKTTSMAALVDMFNADHALHIITVEDPVEVIHPRKRAIVTQREVGSHTRSFARALAAALREDPDVIAIGELRDRETVEMALSAAETGHLVLATMSTPSGAKTIDRLIDMFPPDDQAQVRATLAGALKLVLSQRLLRRADGHGLVAAFEMITGGVPLWSLVRDNKLFQLPSLLQRGRNFGMIGLDDSLRELLGQGLITHDEALVHVEDPRALAPREPSPASPPAGPSGWRLGRGR